MAFNPDEYLKEKLPFNPDDYLKEKSAPGLMTQIEAAAAGIPLSKQIISGISTLGAKSGGDPRSLSDIYSEISPEVAQQLAQAKEQFPGTAIASNVASYVIPGKLIGKAVGGAGEGASALSKIINASKAGAVEGALVGAVEGEGATPLERAKDVASGGLLGGLTGGAVQGGMSSLKAIPSAAQYVGKEISDVPFISDLLKTVKTEAKGTKLTGQKAFQKAYENLDNQVEALALGTKSTAENFPQAIKKVVERAQKAGLKIDLNEKLEPLARKLEALKGQIDSPEILSDIDKSLEFIQRKLTGKKEAQEGAVKNLLSKLKSPEEVVAARRELSGMVPTGESSAFKTSMGEGFGQEILGALKSAESSVPGLQEVNKRSSSAMNALELLGLDRSDFIKNAETGALELKAAAKQKLMNKSRQSVTDTTTSQASREYIRQAKDQLSKANPKLAEETFPKIEQAAEQVDLARAIKGEGILNKGLIPTSSALGLRAGAYAGRAAHSIDKATPDIFKSVAKEVYLKGAKGARLAQELSEAANKDGAGRNAALFSLMQNPEYREMLNEYKKDKE